ncbi:Caudovirales tail fiber assembly protein [compost metagenome]
MTIETTIVTWDEQGFAANDGTVNAYRTAPLTGEYMGPVEVWVSKGTGLPADIYLDAPTSTTPTGLTIVRASTGDKWQQVEDHRGATLYHISTKATIQVTELGPIPAEYTTKVPSSQFDNWNGKAWARDEEAEQHAKLEAARAEQSIRITNANQQIAIIKPAVEGGYAKPEHTQLLADWQRYRYQLTAVPELAGWPASPQWPAEPDKVI